MGVVLVIAFLAVIGPLAYWYGVNSRVDDPAAGSSRVGARPPEVTAPRNNGRQGAGAIRTPGRSHASRGTGSATAVPGGPGPSPLHPGEERIWR